jgi:Leucine-rich repeat (LRR) protein
VSFLRLPTPCLSHVHIQTCAPWCCSTGTLPQALGFCKDLLYLDLSGHSLSGSLPATPPNIQFLNVSSNGLSGPLPEFAVDAQLQFLDLSFNRYEPSVLCWSPLELC